jgi:hypothetical protein
LGAGQQVDVEAGSARQQAYHLRLIETRRLVQPIHCVRVFRASVSIVRAGWRDAS